MSSKNRQQPPSSQTSAFLVMIVGAVAVLALVGWALSRSFSAPETRVTQPPVANTQPGAATSAPVPASTSAADDAAAHAAVPRISPEDLRQRALRREVTIVDVRDAQSYTGGHIPGSLHIPLSRVEGELSYFPKDKPLVFYCT